MKNVLYFTLLFIVFSLFILFPVEEVERKKIGASGFDILHDDLDIRKNLRQDVQKENTAVKKTFGKGEKDNKVYENNLQVESEQEESNDKKCTTPGLVDKEVDRNPILPLKGIRENNSSEKKIDEFLEKRKEKEDEVQTKKKVKKFVENKSKKNQVKPIFNRKKENKQEQEQDGEKKLKEWKKLDGDLIKKNFFKRNTD